MKRLLLTILAALTVSVSAYAQGVGTGASVGKYNIIPLSLPTGLVLSGSSGWASGVSTTNLFNGWTNTTYTTNVTQVWNPTGSPPSMTLVTNITTNSAVTFANFSATQSRYTALEFIDNGTDPSNLVVGYEKSVGGTYYSSNTLAYATNTFRLSLFTNAEDFLIDMGGYGYGRVVSLQFQDVTTSGGWTNLGSQYSSKQGASQ